MGVLANGDLRHKRILAHQALRQLQQSRNMEKWEVYIWLQAKLGLDERQTHIGQFSEWMCDESSASAGRPQLLPPPDKRQPDGR